jgi:beta-lactamase regulating signal transducer with metallopeptidase domain
MTAFLVQFAISNLLASLVLAAIAYAVHRRGRYPVLAHLLWVLVLVKLVTPPVLSRPVAPIPFAVGLPGRDPAAGGPALGGQSLPGSLGDDILSGLLVAWAVGSAVVLVVSLVRIYRFDHLLRRTSHEAPGWIQFMAEGAALRLGLHTVPTIYVTRARLSPLTWWTGGGVRVILPRGLAQDIQSDQLAWVLGHELAHVKRRDHLVRWLEWLACLTFWWNPVAWWARQNLRIDEEASCDALVIEQLGPRPRSYARALLAVVEHLATPAVQPPAVATGIDGGVSLERRFRLIVARQSVQRAPRWLAVGLVGAVVALLPVGVGYSTGAELATSISLASSAVLSESESTFLARQNRGSGARATLGAQRESSPKLAALSATVNSSAAKAAKATKVTKVTKARQARRAQARKAAARTERARERRRADRDDAATRVHVVRLEQIGRSLHF